MEILGRQRDHCFKLIWPGSKRIRFTELKQQYVISLMIHWQHIQLKYLLACIIITGVLSASDSNSLVGLLDALDSFSKPTVQI